MKKTIDWSLPLAALFFIEAAIVLVLVYAPVERSMGIVQKIFYFHLGSATAAFFSFTLVLVFSIAFLATRAARWEMLGLAAAETGVLFCTLVLLTGPLWARPVWGKWWVWDPRLTTTLILWFLYVGYLVLRQAMPGYKGAVVSAVYGTLAFVDVPIVYFSIRWWRGIHPIVIRKGHIGLAAGMVPPLLISITGFILLSLALLRERAAIERISRDIETLSRRIIHE